MTARDELWKYARLLADWWTPPTVTEDRVEKLYNAVRDEVLAEAEKEIRKRIAREIHAEKIGTAPRGWSERYVGGWNDALDAAADKVGDGAA